MRTIDADALIEKIRRLPNAGVRWLVSVESVFDTILKAPTVWPQETKEENKMTTYQTQTNTTTVPSKSETINPPKMTGWICPVCGRGLSPYTSVCPCKGFKGWEITC